FGYLLARTDPGVAKHRGISAFVLDMHAPGVSVRPLRELTGTADFNEVFFDDVVLPPEALIGAPGQGWLIANSTLSHERAGVGAAVVTLRLGLDALVELAQSIERDGRPALEDSAVRDQIGRLSAEIEACASLTRAGLQRWQAGSAQAVDAPLAKLMFSEINVELQTFALELLGAAGAAVDGDPLSVQDGRWQDEWLYARAYTIAGGSSEVMRNVVAERGLNLPREA
ncbi:MAG: acyl-CoA dehydrogenase family protein, partial [Frankiales bacterium]|nr:acyl-CoA dehydrogenase family protein [Frankiales bacterium]